MKIGITTDVLRTTKHPKGVYRYIENLTENLNSLQNNEYNFHNVNNVNECKNLDIIHITDFRVKWLPIIYHSSSKKILTLHGGRFWVPPQSKPNIFKKPKAWLMTNSISYLLFPKIKNEIDIFVTVSDFLKNEVIKTLKVPEEKIRTIHLGVNKIFKNKNLEKENFILSDTPTPELIELYYNLKKEGIKHKLIIFSMREYGYEKAKEAINRLNLQKDVIFKGYVSNNELAYLYNTASIYIRLPYIETFGIPPLEAMSCSCPVAATSTGSLPEVIGDAGILASNTEELKEGICEVLTNEKMKNELIKKGLERAKIFSWKKTAEKTLKVYEEAMK